jgi:hypothetical protein
VSLELHLELWETMQEHIVDIKEAADDFVAVLIENGIEGTKIADATTNMDIKKALLDYDVDIEIDEDFDEYEVDEF